VIGSREVIGDIVVKILRIDGGFADGVTAHAIVCLVDGFHGTGDQVVPWGKVASFGEASVGAGGGEPSAVTREFGRNFHAVVHVFEAVFVIATRGAVGVEQFAGNAGEVDFVGVFVLDFMEAAESASVAEGFPLFGGHFFE